MNKYFLELKRIDSNAEPLLAIYHRSILFLFTNWEFICQYSSFEGCETTCLFTPFFLKREFTTAFFLSNTSSFCVFFYKLLISRTFQNKQQKEKSISVAHLEKTWKFIWICELFLTPPSICSSDERIEIYLFWEKESCSLDSNHYICILHVHLKMNF